MVNELMKIIIAPPSSNNNEGIIRQLLPLNIGTIPDIEAAISKVKNKTNINEIAEYLLNNKPKSYGVKVGDGSWSPKQSTTIKSSDPWDSDFDDEKEMKVPAPPKKVKKVKKTKKKQEPDTDEHKDEFKDTAVHINNINDKPAIETAVNEFASYRWRADMIKPYRQEIQHELVVDFWARNAKLFQDRTLAGILVHLITCYSVPAFKFRYGNESSLQIYNDGLLCHQIHKKQCSVLFGPRIKYDGLDANMVYKFRFKMLSGNIGIGLAANDYVKWNKLLHDVNDLRHSILWKNGFYHYNLNGKNDRSIRSSHYDDIFEDNDIVELEINLADIKCFIRNLTNWKVREREIPIKELVKYPGSTGYLQIVIGFFDDFGSKSWVKGAAKIQIIEQRGEYANTNKK